MRSKERGSFLVHFWAEVFWWLGRPSLFNLLLRRTFGAQVFRRSHLRDAESISRRVREETGRRPATLLRGYLTIDELALLEPEVASPSRRVRQILLSALNSAVKDERLNDERFIGDLSLPDPLCAELARPDYVKRSREVNRRVLEAWLGDDVQRIRGLMYRFVDWWVLGNLAAALGACVLAYFQFRNAALTPLVPLTVVLVLYGFFRTFEVVVYQANVLLFDHYRATQASKPYRLRGYRRIVLALLHNYFEITFWFAASYLLLSHEIVRPGEEEAVSFTGAIARSLFLMVGEPPAVLPGAQMVPVLVLVQGGVGIFMTLASLARFFSLLPSPASLDEVENRQLNDEDDRNTRQVQLAPGTDVVSDLPANTL